MRDSQSESVTLTPAGYHNFGAKSFRTKSRWRQAAGFVAGRRLMITSLPQPVGKPVLFKVISATRAAAWSIPDFNPVKTGHGTNRLHLCPMPLFGRTRGTPSGRKNTPGIFHQPEWRDVDPSRQQVAVGPGFDAGGNRFLFAVAQPEAGEHVEKPAAIETNDGLHSAIDAGVGATDNACLVLAIGTVEMVRPAHVLEIQLWPPPGNQGKVTSDK